MLFRSGMFSMTAAAVTNLKVDPGVSRPSRKLLKKYDAAASAPPAPDAPAMVGFHPPPTKGEQSIQTGQVV